MSRPHRKEQLSSQILKELNNLIIREIEFKNSLITLTGADLSDDLQSATVGVSAIPSSKAEAALKLLDKNRSHLQFLLMKRLKIRHIPKIFFKIDWGLENAAAVEKRLM